MTNDPKLPYPEEACYPEETEQKISYPEETEQKISYPEETEQEVSYPEEAGEKDICPAVIEENKKQTETKNRPQAVGRREKEVLDEVLSLAEKLTQNRPDGQELYQMFMDASEEYLNIVNKKNNK